jgi:predicted DNA-binding transcriptional regulator AlpA
MSNPTSLCDGPVLLNAAEIAVKFGIGVRTFWRWVSEGRFPPAEIRAGSKIVKWRCTTVEAWIEAQANKESEV